jgi:uncharacterized SAM-binding protein YcdF (DUF218 family)
MYFTLSNTLGFFSSVTNFIAYIALVGILLICLRRPVGKTVAVLGLTALVIASLSPLGNMLLTPLEQRFPGLRFPDQPIDGIIILGGSYDTQIRGYVSTIILGEDTAPMAVVANLARRYPQAQIFFSGGDDPSKTGLGEAATAKQIFVSFGIDAARISIEDRSRNTRENALFSYRTIKPSPNSVWLLVTSAYHMPRATGAFRKAGFKVIGFPVGWRTHGWRDFWWPERSATDNLRRIDIAMHEWAGLSVYWLLGYSNEWFPAVEAKDTP